MSVDDKPKSSRLLYFCISDTKKIQTRVELQHKIVPCGINMYMY